MSGRGGVDRGLYAFYGVVALIALAGQAGAAEAWLRWPLLLALGAVAAVELGGIVLSAYGDQRRRLGERALAARALSAAVAAGAVAVNWLGHHDRLQAGFFAGMSALGYLVWLLHSGARRRDELRAAGNLPPVAPAYGWWHWLRHPGLTRRARALALAGGLGLYDSLAAAGEAVRAGRRQAAIAALLRRKLAAGRDPLAAEIAVTVYDLDEVAARLAAAADYAGLAGLLADDLTPVRLAGAEVPRVPAGRAGDGTLPHHPVPPDPATRSGALAHMPPAGTGNGAGHPAAPASQPAGRRMETVRVPAQRRVHVETTRDAGPTKAVGPRTDAELLEQLQAVPQDPDGTVPVRRAAAALGTGPDRARRLLTRAGLRRDEHDTGPSCAPPAA